MDHAKTNRLGLLLSPCTLATALWVVYGAACTGLKSTDDGATPARDGGSMRDGRTSSRQSGIEPIATPRDANHVPDDGTANTSDAVADGSIEEPVVDAAPNVTGGCAPGVFDESHFDKECFQ